MSTILAYFGPGQPLHLLFFVALIVFFAYFYTHNVAFKTDDVAENLKNQNGFIPGIRPGKKTEEYLEYVVNRVLVLGSGYLALVCLLPEILSPPVRDPVLLRRHLGADRRVGDDGHDPADPVAPAGAPVRGLDREVAVARPQAHGADPAQSADAALRPE